MSAKSYCAFAQEIINKYYINRYAYHDFFFMINDHSEININFIDLLITISDQFIVHRIYQTEMFILTSQD